MEDLGKLIVAKGLKNSPKVKKLPNLVTLILLFHFIVFSHLSSKQTSFYSKCFFSEMGQSRPIFVYFRSFQIQFYRNNLDLSGIRTQIVRVEGEHTDHLTTTMARNLLFPLSNPKGTSNARGPLF